MKPLISIVIANFNYGRFIEDAIKSVVSQDGFSECELIVCDAASTDNSVEVIKKYADQIAWWCSEKDKGQSDAFNKGFSHARGELLTWLNADDILLPGTLRAVLDFKQRHPRVEWIQGGVLHFDKSGRIVKMRIGAQPPRCMHRVLPMTCIGGPSTFFSKKRLDEVGGVDVDLHYIMDIDLWYKFFRCGMKLYHLNCYFWGFRMHEESKTSALLVNGPANPRHVIERKIVYGERYPASTLTRAFGVQFWRFYKILSGSFLKSYFDTWRHRGANVLQRDCA